MEFVSIQYLRAIAALMVVLYHIEIPLRRLGYTGFWPDWLSSGVDIFFIISGVIMWLTTCNKPVSPFNFYFKRLIRIVPLYWFVTSFLLFMMLVFPHHVQSAKFELYHVVTSYFFIASVNPFTGSVQPVVILGWTLNYEMVFYLIFGASLLLPVQMRIYATLGVLAGLVILGTRITAGEHPVFAFYTSDIILEFGLGLLIGYLVIKSAYISPILSWIALLSGVFMISCLGLKHAGLRSVVWGLPAGLIVASVLSLELQGRLREFRLLHSLGNASYSIYLTHEISIAAMGQFWLNFSFASFALGKFVIIITLMTGAAAAGVAVHLFVEQPILRLLRGKSFKAAFFEGLSNTRSTEIVFAGETPMKEVLK